MRIMKKNINEIRLNKLYRMIKYNTNISENDKQPFYTLIGNRLLNNSRLPQSLYNSNGIKIGNSVFNYDRYYKDVIDYEDSELLVKIYHTVKPYTLDYYQHRKINENNKIKHEYLYDFDSIGLI